MFRSSASCFRLITIFIVLIATESKIKQKTTTKTTSITTTSYTSSLCMGTSNTTLRARHKSCFLYPDTGPCRADIVQWYFDTKLAKCFRFFWGGCQGNGNRFTTQKQCYDYCYINMSLPLPYEIPNFCQVAFDYGSCFGQYIRWAWDPVSKTCRRRLYSGCGGNQNNFETRSLCYKTCLTKSYGLTTCIPWNVNEKR